MKIKVNLDVTGPLQPGTYILVFDPRQVNADILAHTLVSRDETGPECTFLLIPSYDPYAIRFLKVEEPVIAKP